MSVRLDGRVSYLCAGQITTNSLADPEIGKGGGGCATWLPSLSLRRAAPFAERMVCVYALGSAAEAGTVHWAVLLRLALHAGETISSLLPPSLWNALSHGHTNVAIKTGI